MHVGQFLREHADVHDRHQLELHGVPNGLLAVLRRPHQLHRLHAGELLRQRPHLHDRGELAVRRVHGRSLPQCRGDLVPDLHGHPQLRHARDVHQRHELAVQPVPVRLLRA